MRHVIAHNPHSSSAIPYRDTYVTDPEPEIDLVTDWHVETMFAAADEMLTFPWSRIWCDVERFRDDPLETKGLGLAYTRTLEGAPLRERPDMTPILDAYEKHHRALEAMVARAVAANPVVLVDAHSFSDYQASFFCDGAVMPDFCIGFDRPTPLVHRLAEILAEGGCSVGFNAPFAGALVPPAFADHPGVCAIMIEVNKRLYLESPFRRKARDLAGVRLKLEKAMACLRIAD
jgi:N-formylglutamate amidohydrolase